MSHVAGNGVGLLTHCCLGLRVGIFFNREKDLPGLDPLRDHELCLVLLKVLPHLLFGGEACGDLAGDQPIEINLAQDVFGSPLHQEGNIRILLEIIGPGRLEQGCCISLTLDKAFKCRLIRQDRGTLTGVNILEDALQPGKLERGFRHGAAGLAPILPGFYPGRRRFGDRSFHQFAFRLLCGGRFVFHAEQFLQRECQRGLGQCCDDGGGSEGKNNGLESHKAVDSFGSRFRAWQVRMCSKFNATHGPVQLQLTRDRVRISYFSFRNNEV